MLACSPGAPERPPHIVLILADTLRADHLGAWGYPLDTSPALDRFAAENLRFSRAISPAPWTSPAVASLFTGLYPTAHGVTQHVEGRRIPTDALSPEHVTLAEQLRDAGYATVGISVNAWVSEKRGYAQGFERFLSRTHFDAGALTQLALQQVDALALRGDPFFLYLQYMDPHIPNDPPARLVDRFHPDGAARSPRSGALAELTEVIARYDAEVHQLDRGISALFAGLDARGLYEDAVIAVVSDHGEQFWERGEYGHGQMLHDEETHVPLILRAPGLRGVVDDTVSTLDLAPTLLELAGLEPSDASQGHSLLSARAERVQRGALSEATVGRNHKALTVGSRRLVLDFSGRSRDVSAPGDARAVVGLYDLAADPLEKAPLDDAPDAASLRGSLLRQLAESVALRGERAPAEVELDADSVRELEVLGYVE